jgi:hypothetical protein
MAIRPETLELIMERMALDDDFRSMMASMPYRALVDLGISVEEIREIRDAMTGGDTVALGDRTSAAQTTWGILMGKVSGGTWCG